MRPPDSSCTPRCRLIMRSFALSASAMWCGQVGSRRHSKTLRSMIRAPGSSPSRCRCSIGRVSMTKAPAATSDACQVGGSTRSRPERSSSGTTPATSCRCVSAAEVELLAQAGIQAAGRTPRCVGCRSPSKAQDLNDRQRLSRSASPAQRLTAWRPLDQDHGPAACRLDRSWPAPVTRPVANWPAEAAPANVTGFVGSTCLSKGVHAGGTSHRRAGRRTPRK
jgi:hypothetical protein